MVLIFLFFLFFLALLSYLVRRRRLSFALATYFLCGMIIFGTSFLPSLLLRQLQRYPRLEKVEWQKRTAIILLGSGGTRWVLGGAVTSSTFGYARLLEAARLFHACRESGGQCVVIPCGGDVLKLGVTEAEIMKRELKGIGVPEAAILPESKSRNTFQNAQFAKDLIRGMDLEQFVLVTSGVHMARAVKFFTHFGLEVLPAPSDEQQATPSVFPQGMNFLLMDASLHELLGVLKFHIYNWMGWNAKVV